MLLTVMVFALTAQTAWAVELSGAGTIASPYLINSADDWNTFATNVSNGTTYSGKVVELNADISVSTMVGTSEHKFMGMFNGAGHTLTFNLGDSNDRVAENFIAPFRYVDGVTIMMLHVSGTIYTQGKYAAGVMAHLSGDCTLTNCWSSITIDNIGRNTDEDRDFYHGGLIAKAFGDGNTVTINNSLFNGQFIGRNIQSCGGFVGGNEGFMDISNCYFAPTTQGFSSGGSATFSRDGITNSVNNYYRGNPSRLGEKQGEILYNDVNGSDLVAKLGPGWEVNENVESFRAAPISDPTNIGIATITGIADRYAYANGDPIAINYTMSDVLGRAMTKGIDYTVELDGEDVTSASPLTVTNYKAYALTFRGIGSYTGERTFTFKVNFTLPEGLAEDDDFTYPETGFFYVNMPRTDTKTLTFTDGNITSFKVYDSGGKSGKFEDNTDGYLVINAPTGYVIKLTGTIAIHNANQRSFFRVRDGDNSSASQLLFKTSTGDGVPTDIGTLYSTGNSLFIQFKKYGTYLNYDGLDLTATLIDAETEHTISITNPTMGGSVLSNKSTAKYNEEVSLTATPPSSDYLVDHISVKDENNMDVSVSGNDWYTYYANNKATFNMPTSDVSVTSSFISAKTAAEGLHINMPYSGDIYTTATTYATIPSSIKSFKVYDHEGKDANPDYICGSYLVMTAPSGYKFMVTGTIATQYEKGRPKEYLDIYDGNSKYDPKLVCTLQSDENGVAKNIGIVMSSNQYMMIYFSSRQASSFMDLTVTLVPPSDKYAITVNPATGGSIAVNDNKTQETAGNTVTVTANPDEGYLLSELSVADANGNKVNVTGGWFTNNQATFIMPATAVSVTPTFTNSRNGLSINMPTTGTLTATIPASVQSFKVYDDGGPDGLYTKAVNGTLILVGPEGYHLNLTGTIVSHSGVKLTVSDPDDNDNVLINEVTSNAYVGEGGSNPMSVGTATGTANRLKLYFGPSTIDLYDGLDLDVTLIAPNLDYNISLTQADGGTIACNQATSKLGQTITVEITPNKDYCLKTLTVKDANGYQVITNYNWYTNTATFTMPSSHVTVTPVFSNDLSAANGFFVNMPATGNSSLTIPSTMTSLKVYDDGGASGDYSTNCTGSLTLTAPEGKVIVLTGSVKSVNSDEQSLAWLTVYNGTTVTETNRIGNERYGKSTGEDIGTLVSGQSMTLSFQSNASTPFSGLDLTAYFTSLYNITYHGADGLANENPTTYTKYTATINLAAPATKDYYTFAGWYDNAECMGEAVTAIAGGSTGNKDLYAKWTANPFAITYTLNKGTMAEGESNPATYTVETAVTLKAPVRNGYEFGGWYADAEFSGNAVTTIAVGSTGDKAFYAKWTPVSYTITYALNGGALAEGESNPDTYTIETATFSLESPQKTGYWFRGWYDGDTQVERIVVGSTGNKTLAAHWEARKYSIYFLIYEGGNTYQEIFQDYDSDITAPEDPTRSGYVFNGWDQAVPAKMPAENMTITAKWKKLLTHTDIKINNVSPSYNYTGEAIEPAVTLKDGSTTIPASAYTVTYADNMNAGTATITITAKDDNESYSGSSTVNFTIEQIAGTCVYKIDNVAKYFGEKPFINPLTFTGDGTVTYSSSDTNVATVDETGKVTLKRKGTAKITATISDGMNYYYRGNNISAFYIISVSDIGYLYQLSDKRVFYDGEEHSLLFPGLEPPEWATVRYAFCPDYIVDVEDDIDSYRFLLPGIINPYISKFNISYPDIQNYLEDYIFANYSTSECPSFTNVGKYPVFHEVIGEDGSLLSRSLYSIEIEPLQVDLSWSESVFDYDGTEKKVTATATGLIEGDECSVTVEGNTATAIGKYSATATGLSNSNYVLPEDGLTCTFDILRKMEGLFADGNQWTGYVAQEDLAVPAGLTAYAISEANTIYATVTEANFIPKGMPVLLNRNDKTVNLYRASAGAGTEPSTNLLQVSEEAKNVKFGEYFVLYNDEFVPLGTGIMPAGSFYLPISRAAGARSLRIVYEGDTTGMEDVRWQTEEGSSGWYSIDGRKLDGKPTRKGLYIHNGKKEVVK